jgi:hypothetical protein
VDSGHRLAFKYGSPLTISLITPTFSFVLRVRSLPLSLSRRHLVAPHLALPALGAAAFLLEPGPSPFRLALGRHVVHIVGERAETGGRSE